MNKTKQTLLSTDTQLLSEPIPCDRKIAVTKTPNGYNASAMWYERVTGESGLKPRSVGAWGVTIEAAQQRLNEAIAERARLAL